ncbi:hypothetical protein L1987_43190 [Smallanthus sonchifolius]|uniref:Uncharacterized protein n=1 Tax=Smallanthus sonchifolius TaxID=185202 RepID=A0ACB9GM05_9ASTR|nr:hypothetical protein L1987_43190 [Smallanthus sonchifolius]
MGSCGSGILGEVTDDHTGEREGCSYKTGLLLIVAQLLKTSSFTTKANIAEVVGASAIVIINNRTGAAMEEGKVSKYGFEIVKAFSNNHLDLRPSYFSIFKGNENGEKDRYSLIRDPNDFQQGIYDKTLSCFGCGVRWYYAAFLYFGNYYLQDPRERAGLAASAIAINAVDGMKLYDELFNDYGVRKMVSLVNDLRATGRWDLFQGKSPMFSR